MRFIRHLPKLHARRLATAATRDGLVLWGHPRFRSGRVVWMLGELGVRYTLRPIASRTDEMDCAAFLAVSPRRKVPVLEHGDFALTESVAINTYLADRFAPRGRGRGGRGGLAPAHGSRERALYDAWLHTINTELDAQGLYVLRKHRHLARVYGAAPVAVDAARAYFATQLRSATAALAARPYLVSDEFTAADLLLTSVLLWARNEGWLPDEPVLHEYVERNAARPACEALQRMKRELPSGTAPVEIFPS